MSLLTDEVGGAVAPSVLGRDADLALLERFLLGTSPSTALVILGAPGIGKTTLWDAAVRMAGERGVRVLATRSSPSEAQLPYASLIDVCDSIGPSELAELPAAQRAALEAVLLRAEPPGVLHDTAIALGLLGAVRASAARGPVVIAVDDLQWLDQPSDKLLTFLARRVGEAPVRFLLARRPARPGALEQVLARRGLDRLQVTGLSVGAVRRLLFERLGLTLSRQVLRQIVEATEGNPLFALEVGRVLVERGIPTAADEIPLPDTVEELFVERVARLADPVRRVLVALALSAQLTVDQVTAAVGATALDDAIAAGVAAVDGGRVRASHPLLAATARHHSRLSERRELHRALAAVMNEEQLRLLHLALATIRPDAALAGGLAGAAEDACARGARRQAVMLAEHAVRLTPATTPERAVRVMALADRLDDAGKLQQLTALLEAEMESLPHGPLRARAWQLLGDGANVASIEEQNRYLERAVAECEDDADLRAVLLARMGGNWAAAAISRLAEAERLALRAVGGAKDMRVRRECLYQLAWPRVLSGRAIDDLCEQSRVADDPSAYVSATPERVAAKRLMWRGQVDESRRLLDELAALADARGEPTSYAMVRLHLCELEMRIGNLDAASRLLDEWTESADFETQFRPQYQRCRALLAAGRGDAGEATRWASEALEKAKAAGSRWDELEALRARGTAALLARAPEKAVDDLMAVWEHCEREGVHDPGAFPVAPELVEALVDVGELHAARTVTKRMDDLAKQLEHPWARVTSRRCRALVAVGKDPQDDAATALLQEAAEEYGALGLHFEAARCLLTLGKARRRAKRWREAREILEEAASGFDVLSATGWLERTRELARVGARRPGSSGSALTPSEQRVVELAAEGLANKQIAATMFLAVNTVEVHLAHAYAKLGVHSRSQLAKALSTRPPAT